MRPAKFRKHEGRNGNAMRWLFVLLLVVAAVGVASCTAPWVPGDTAPGGAVSPWAVSVPKAPAGVQASDGTYTDKVRVTWAAVSGATSYEVWRGPSSSSSSSTKIGSPTTTTHDDTSATAGTNYTYWVKAKNTAGTSGLSTPDSGCRTLPAPTNVQASNGTYTDKVRVTWTAVSGAASYEVWRGTSSSSSSASKIGTATPSTYDDTNATAGTTYEYWVKAKSSAGISSFSAGANPGRRLGPAAPPTNVQASDDAYADKVRVTWTASAGATSYEVWRSTSNNSSSASKIGTPTSTSYDDTSATAGKTYYYWVRASNAAGTSGFGSYNSGRLANLAVTLDSGSATPRLIVGVPCIISGIVKNNVTPSANRSFGVHCQRRVATDELPRHH
jgi:fibronectin type 3 domain-containing protein